MVSLHLREMSRSVLLQVWRRGGGQPFYRSMEIRWTLVKILGQERYQIGSPNTPFSLTSGRRKQRVVDRFSSTHQPASKAIANGTGQTPYPEEILVPPDHIEPQPTYGKPLSYEDNATGGSYPINSSCCSKTHGYRSGTAGSGATFTEPSNGNSSKGPFRSCRKTEPRWLRY